MTNTVVTLRGMNGFNRKALTEPSQDSKKLQVCWHHMCLNFNCYNLTRELVIKLKLVVLMLFRGLTAVKTLL